MKKMCKPGRSPQTPLIKLHLLQLHTGGPYSLCMFTWYTHKHLCVSCCYAPSPDVIVYQCRWAWACSSLACRLFPWCKSGSGLPPACSRCRSGKWWWNPAWAQRPPASRCVPHRAQSRTPWGSLWKEAAQWKISDSERSVTRAVKGCFAANSGRRFRVWAFMDSLAVISSLGKQTPLTVTLPSRPPRSRFFWSCWKFARSWEETGGWLKAALLWPRVCWLHTRHHCAVNSRRQCTYASLRLQSTHTRAHALVTLCAQAINHGLRGHVKDVSLNLPSRCS